MKDHRADLQPFTGRRRTRLQQLLALSEESDVKTLGSSANGRYQELEAELQHQTRNLLATVQAIASRTLGASDEAAAFGARLAVLGRVQLLKSSAEGEIDLAELIGQEMKAHGIADGRVTFEGEPVGFPRAKTELLALAIHELTTNARKHGALASRGSALSIRWWTYGSSGHRRLTLRWAEARDQSCRAVGQGRGFGRELLERALPYSLDATTELEIGAGWVHCQIDKVPPPNLDITTTTGWQRRDEGRRGKWQRAGRSGWRSHPTLSIYREAESHPSCSVNPFMGPDPSLPAKVQS
jgi:two-component system, chemotaxis family, CheB/CheR fusion protein